MADDQNRAVIITDHFLQQINGLHIQIIGRLIQNQKIMGLGKNESQHQPVLFAAGQGGDFLRHFEIIK